MALILPPLVLTSVRLDDEYIVFRGNEEEAASAHLRGKLVLCLTEPLSIKHLKLTLTGVSKIAWVYMLRLLLSQGTPADPQAEMLSQAVPRKRVQRSEVSSKKCGHSKMVGEARPRR